MTFAEKIKTLRKAAGLSQEELAEKVGVSARTVRGWEADGRYPKKQALYSRLCEVLDCDISYIMTDTESFITAASEDYGSRGERQARAILNQAAVLFAGGDLSDEDQIAFLNEIQALYLDSKKKAGKFTPRKYRKDQEGGASS
ncbi:MAG: helix-turn-helix transcriptional regulator [Eubacterium sp.]|nr:helix-turn-helix transcriptional regulator [Eubacterium sp.]